MVWSIIFGLEIIYMGSRNQIQSQFQGINLFVHHTKYPIWGESKLSCLPRSPKYKTSNSLSEEVYFRLS